MPVSQPGLGELFVMLSNDLKFWLEVRHAIPSAGISTFFDLGSTNAKPDNLGGL